MIIQYLRPEDFEILGISIHKLKTEMRLTVNGKEFERKRDLPLKFKQKVSTICQEIEEKEKDFFVIQHVRSYSIWEEIINLSIANSEKRNTLDNKTTFIKENKTSEIKERVLSNKNTYSNLSSTKIFNTTTTKNNSSFQSTNDKSSMPEMKVVVRKDKKSEQLSSEAIAENEEVSSVKPEITPVTQAKTVRKYRGVIIEGNQSNPSTTMPEKTPVAKPKTIRKYRGVIIED